MSNSDDRLEMFEEEAARSLLILWILAPSG